MADWLNQFLAENGLAVLYLGTLIVLLLCGIGVPISEEVTFLAAGYAAAKMQISLLNLVFLCVIGVIGIMVGDCVPFTLGRRYGMDFLKHRWFGWIITPKRIEKTQEYFRRHGAKTVFVGRFIAGLRMPTFFMSASMGVRFRTFLFWDLMGALISCPTSIALAWYFGPKAEEILHESKWYLLGFAAIAAAYGVYHYLTHREKPEATPAAPPAVPAKSPAQPNLSRAQTDVAAK